MKKKPSPNLALERRKQRTLHKLGSNHPVCVLCGESDWRCLEAHHVGQEAYDHLTVILCRNCHRKASDAQWDHPGRIDDQTPSLLECIGHVLLGLADFFALLVGRLREFGLALIERAKAEFAAQAGSTAPAREG